MFLREVVTGRREGNPVRYAQIVEASCNDQGTSRHRVLLSLGRVDRLERALFALVAQRLADPGSKLACADWLAHDVWLPGTCDVRLQHLYGAMDFFDDCHEELEAALYAHRRSLFDRVELVYYDTTSTCFECDEAGDEPAEYGLRHRGHSRDLWPDLKQIVVGLAVDQQGLRIVSDVYSGDTDWSASSS
jgi:hypothetical protein